MMKIVRKGLLKGTAVVAVSFGSPALACELEPAAGPSGTTVQVSAESLTLVGATPSVAFDNLAGVLLGNPAFNGSGCTPNQVKAALTTSNPTIASAATVPAGTMFSLVRPRVAPVALSPVQPVAAVEQPAPQVAAPPPAQPVRVAVAPPVRTAPLPAQVDLSEVRASLAALRAEDTRLRQELAGIPTSQLTPEQLQLLNTLASIPNWEAKLRNLPENGVVQTASLPAEQQQVVQQVVATESLVESYVGRSALDWITILAFLGVIALAFYVIKFVNGRIKKVEDGKKTLDEDLEDLARRVSVTEEKIEGIAQQGGYKVISLESGWYQKIMNLTEGGEEGLEILLDGEAGYTILVNRGDADNCYIKAGIKGQQSQNAVKIGNLEKIVRSACNPENFRLSNKIGGPVAVAA